MSEMIRLVIDNIPVEIEKGKTILDAALKYNIFIPTLCYHPRLTRFGACRLCLVQVQGFRKLVAACTTPATEGMVVQTVTPEINSMRKTIVELLLLHHPLDCLTCDVGGRCDLQRLAYSLGVKEDRFGFRVETYPVDDTNLFIQRNMKKCVLCGRCVRVCDEVRNNGALGFFHRGSSTEIGYPFSKLVNCEFCGQCVSVCPVGALISKLSAYESRPWQSEKVRTVCAYCGCGCTYYLEHKKNKVIRVSSQEGVGANDGLLCVKGRFGYDFVSADERLTKPLIRKNGSLVESSWPEAIGLAAERLKQIKQSKGAQAIAGIGSARCTNEENYLFQKFMRAGIGTNNVDCFARLEHAPSMNALYESLGVPAATNSLREILGAEAILVIGSNTTASHVIAGLYIKQAVRAQGAKLIVVDPRQLDLTRFADQWLPVKPGTDVALINGLIRIILENGWENKEFIQKHTLGFEQLKTKLGDYTPEKVASITGISQEQLKQTARVFAQARTGCILFGMGVVQNTHGVDNVQALINLCLVTGKLGREFCGLYPLRTTCNVQGACDMGTLPDFLPGYQAVSDEVVRSRFADAWRTAVPEERGLAISEMLHVANAGGLSAMYIMGENLVHSYPDAALVHTALEKLDFLVVQDIFLTETARLADVVLPAASFAETLGTFTNLERRVQMVKPAVNPPGGAKQDWEIICQVANHFGYEMYYRFPEQIMDEIRRLVSMYAGISYDHLAGDGIRDERVDASQVMEGGLQWPCPQADRPGLKFFAMEDFPHKAKFRAVDYHLPAEAPAGYPFLMIIGGNLFHHQSGAMSCRARGLKYLRPESYVEVHPLDAQKLGVKKDDLVKVNSPYGELEVRAKLSEEYKPGIVFMPNHYAEAPANCLQQNILDAKSASPGNKHVWVNLRAA